MTSADNLPPAKSCVWLDYVNYIIPLNVLRAPWNPGFQESNVTFGFLKDKFLICIVKTEDSCVKVAVCRNRVNSNEKHDDGYALRFYITVTGFDEEPQVSIMKHDDEKAEPSSFFKLTEKILKNINTSHHVFDVFVVAHMLEFKNIVDEENVNKMRLDIYMSSYVKSKLTEKEYRDLCFIFKCSALDDIFTGRLPVKQMDKILQVFRKMSKNNAKVAEYLKARYNGKYTKDPDADLSNILKYADLQNDQRPLPLLETCVRYLMAHRLGLDCMKVILTDYLLRLLDKNSKIVLKILDVALIVHDEDLFNKAVFSFLNNFHEVTGSDIFQKYSKSRAAVTRLIIHSVRVWITNNDVYIPGWKQQDQPATEL